MWRIYRFIFWIFVSLCILFQIQLCSASQDEETYFVVTAYYSPLPGQLKYTTGSYSWDIRLNGEWHTTASGKEVFPGLLAGPINYPFGTKIYFEGYGIGSIEDRGGAIVKAGERWHSYDRIDIWMWYGDEGLARALTWGTRTIKWKIVVPSAEVSLSFWESAIWSLTKLDVNPENSNSDHVLELQKIFTKAWLYQGELDGKYTSIQNELIEFQLKSWLISSSQDESAWWYGPKTIAALREEYGNSSSTLLEEPKEDFALYNHRQASEKYKIILQYGDLQVNPDSDSEAIEDLQKLLTTLWEYEWSIDGKYKTVEASLISLQKKIGLISNRDDWGAGYFWNKTKSALWAYYEEENDKALLETDTQSKEQTYNLSSRERKTLDTAVKKLQDNYPKEVLSELSQQIDESSASTNNNYFIVTAYYSPLPDQEYYITGNYEDELILNGRGIAGASGKKVFSGMLAAPGAYSFGTKIYLDGLGIWSVEDRGGAIVPAGQRGYSYDRIDVWMGYGDEWLLRANFWGKRKVYGYVVDSSNQTSLNYKNVPSPSWATTGLKKQQKAVPIPDVFDVSLWKWSDEGYVSQMQDILIELWYTLESNGIYDENTIESVYNFQVKHEIISTENELGSWFYGPKTRTKLSEIYSSYLDEKQKKEDFLKNITDLQDTFLNKAQDYVDSLGKPKYGETSYEVRELQITLAKLWYFHQKDTAIFWSVTRQALIDYQLDKEIIVSDFEIWAGLFWPKTRASLVNSLYEMYFQEHLVEHELEELYAQYLAAE